MMCLTVTLQSFTQVHLVLRCGRKCSSTLTHTVELRHLRDDTFFVVREAPFSDIAVGCIYQLLKGPVALTRFRAALASDALVELRAGADASVRRTGVVSALHCSGEDAGCVVDVLDCLPGAQRGVPFGGATVQALFQYRVFVEDTESSAHGSCSRRTVVVEHVPEAVNGRVKAFEGRRDILRDAPHISCSAGERLFPLFESYPSACCRDAGFDSLPLLELAIVEYEWVAVDVRKVTVAQEILSGDAARLVGDCGNGGGCRLAAQSVGCQHSCHLALT